MLLSHRKCWVTRGLQAFLKAVSAQAAVTRPTSESPGPIGPAVAGDDRNDRKWECCRGFGGMGKVRPTPRDCQVLPRTLMPKIKDPSTRADVADSPTND